MWNLVLLWLFVLKKLEKSQVWNDWEVWEQLIEKLPELSSQNLGSNVNLATNFPYVSGK